MSEWDLDTADMARSSRMSRTENLANEIARRGWARRIAPDQVIADTEYAVCSPRGLALLQTIDHPLGEQGLHVLRAAHRVSHNARDA